MVVVNYIYIYIIFTSWFWCGELWEGAAEQLGFPPLTPLSFGGVALLGGLVGRTWLSWWLRHPSAKYAHLSRKIKPILPGPGWVKKGFRYIKVSDNPYPKMSVLPQWSLSRHDTECPRLFQEGKYQKPWHHSVTILVGRIAHIALRFCHRCKSQKAI